MKVLSAEIKQASRALPLRSSVRTFWSVQRVGLLLLIVISFFPALFHKEEPLFFLLLASAVFVAWKTGEPLRIDTPINRPLCAFIVWVLITTPFAIEPSYSFAEWRKLLVQALVFYWALLVAREQDKEQLVKEVLIAITIGVAILSVISLHEFIARGGTWQDRAVRASAPHSDYNWLTTYMVIAIPLLIAACLSAQEAWKRVAAVMVTALAVLTQIASYTRAGWLAMAAEGAAIALLTANRRILLWFSIGILVIVIMLFALAQLGYQQQTLDPWTWDARLAVWKLQLNEILEHPVTGIGYGSNTFMKRFSGYHETEKADGPHSTFLMVAMGSGVPALILLLYTFVTSVVTLLRKVCLALDRETRAFLTALGVMVIGFMARNMFDYMFMGSLGYLFWILVGVGIAMVPESGEC